MLSFLLRIASTAAQAGQSQYFAPAALISLAGAATAGAWSAPKTCAPASDSANPIKLSIGMISASNSFTYVSVASASLSVPTAASQASAAAFVSLLQVAAFINSLVFSTT